MNELAAKKLHAPIAGVLRTGNVDEKRAVIRGVEQDSSPPF
jgi:hypothetical protein